MRRHVPRFSSVEGVGDTGVIVRYAISMGLDPSPRAAQEDEFGDFGYPFTNTIGENAPEKFRVALEQTKQRLLAQTRSGRMVTINGWNEWTEGNYLEPDAVDGLEHLAAVRNVFGTR